MGDRERGGTLRSLRHRPFKIFFYTQLPSQIGNWISTVTGALLVLDLTEDNAFAVGILTACQFGPLLLMGAWGGLLADRMDKRQLLIYVHFFAMAKSFGFAALAFAGDPPLTALYAVALIGGLGLVFDNPARRSYFVELVPREDIANAVSLHVALMTSSRMVGPALAGILVHIAGYGWCFVIDALTCVPVVIGLLMTRPEERRITAPTPRAPGQVREGLRYVRGNPELLVSLTMMSIVGVTAVNLPVLLPVYVTDSLGESRLVFTFLLSVVSVGSLASALYTARRPDVTMSDLVKGAIAFGLSNLALALSPVAASSFAVALVVGFASVLFLSSAMGMIQMRSAESFRGRVLALHSMVFIGSAPIGGPLAGGVAELTNPRVALLMGTAGCFAAALWGSRSYRRRTATQSAESVGISVGSAV